MPTGKKFDFQLNGKGYILYRPKNGPRSWQRSGVPDTPQVEQPRIASEFGGLPGAIDYPEVWNDWSGGFGYAYRHPRDENSYFGFLANPNFYHWSTGFDARFNRQLVHCQKLKIPAARYATFSTNVTNFIEARFLDVFGGAPGQTGLEVFLTSRSTRIFPTGLGAEGSKFDLDPSSSYNTGIGRPAIFGSFVFIPGDDSASTFGREVMTNLAPISPGSGTNARGFRTAGNRLWQYTGLFGGGRRIYVNNMADPNAIGNPADFSATLTIGNAQKNINDMVSLAGQLFLGLEDGLYAGDTSGTFYDVLGDLSGQAHGDNFRDLTVHNAQVVGQHVTGVYAYSPSSTLASKVRQIGPTIRSNKSPISGYIRCLEPMGPWLFAGLWTGSQGYILCGTDPDGVSAYDWYPMQQLPSQSSPQRIHIDGITSNSANTPISARMWVATDPSINTVLGGTSPLYYFEIPSMHGNPLLPALGFSPNYANSARIDLGNTNGRAPLTPKVYRAVEVQADNLDGSQRWGLIYYTIDESPLGRVLLGTINTSPQSVLYFPANQGSFVMGQSIELSLESYIAAGAEATTPVYRTIVLRQTYAPRSVDVISAIVDLGDNMVDRQGTRMRPGAVQINEMRGLVATGPVPLVDLLGNSSWVKVLAPVEEQEEWQEGDDNPSVLATIKMAVLSFSGPATGG